MSSGFILAYVCIMLVVFIVVLAQINNKKREIQDTIKGLADNTLEMTPEEFM